MSAQNIKIAFVTDDGTTISQHFGRARYYEVVTLENSNITHRERRDKTGHHTFATSDHQHGHGPGEHGFDATSRSKHNSMIATIADCQVLVTRGMGAGAYQHLSEANITPIVTSLGDIDSAIHEYVDGNLVNHIERLH